MPRLSTAIGVNPPGFVMPSISQKMKAIPVKVTYSRARMCMVLTRFDVSTRMQSIPANAQRVKFRTDREFAMIISRK